MSPDRQRILTFQRREVNRMFASLADGVRNATDRLPADTPVTPAHRAAILAEVDTGLDAIFGRYPGDEASELRRIIVRDTDAARLAPLDAAVRQWRGAMTPALRAKVDAEAKGE